MFKVMGQAGSIDRVVLASSTYGDLCIESWFFMVFGQVDSKAIIQLEYLCIERVVLVRSIYSAIAEFNRVSLRLIAAAGCVG